MALRFSTPLRSALLNLRYRCQHEVRNVSPTALATHSNLYTSVSCSRCCRHVHTSDCCRGQEGMMAQAQRRQCPAVSSSHSRGILCKAQAFTDGSEVEVPVGSMEGVLPQDGKQDPDEGKIATLRCTVRDVPGQEADLLADTLLSLGAQSASVTEHRPNGKEEQEIYDTQQGDRKVWDRCVVTANFSTDHNVNGTLQIAKAALLLEDLQQEIIQVADSDWVEGICASYQPTCITEKLWIIPAWSDPRDDDAINIRVEPGLAFGTGEHPTTRLCLREIFAQKDFSGKYIIDYGTGSGVLALTALKLGARLAVGVDTDALAVRAASQNGVLNKFSGKWITLQCQPTVDGPDPLDSNPQGFVLPTEYDLCVANILQGPLLNLKHRLTRYVKPGGTLMLSGILKKQVPEVQEAYADSFEDFQIQEEEVWSLIVARKKS